MKSKLYVIGDIHGNINALTYLMSHINPDHQDTLVFVGDYIDRGEDSYAVIEYLLELQQGFGNAVFLLGNHEKMLLDSMDDQPEPMYWKRQWLKNGGGQTLASYEQHGFKAIPRTHLDFYLNLLPYYETDDYIFTHATPSEHTDIDHQSEQNLLWSRPTARHYEYGYRHVSGKVVVTGHTPRFDIPTRLAHLIMVDTGSGKGGGLTALELTTMKYAQVKENELFVGDLWQI